MFYSIRLRIILLHASIGIVSLCRNPRGKFSSVNFSGTNLGPTCSGFANSSRHFALQICVRESEIFVSCWTGYYLQSFYPVSASYYIMNHDGYFESSRSAGHPCKSIIGLTTYTRRLPDTSGGVTLRQKCITII